MRSKAILEELKANAYTGEAAALGDALGDMVHWLAAHREDLRGRDVDTLMSVCLALYKNELEKSWDVSIYDVPEANVPATILHGSEGVLGVASSAEDLVRSMTEHDTSTQTGVESAIEAMVALRRPEATTEAASAIDPTIGARRRRWTDSECWSLTLRTT
jgi:hypothetical protein